MRQEAPLVPQVADAGLRPAVAAEQQPAAEDDHRDDSNDFNNGEPELHLTKHFHVGQVNGVDNHEEGCSRGPGWDLRVPELDIFTDCSQLSHGNQHVQYPVVPARGETRETAPVFISKVAKGACYRLFNHHFT